MRMDRLLSSISCLCVTHGKAEMLKRAINCFRGQQYPNKQLIVVYETNDTTTERFLKSEIRTDDQIKLMPEPVLPAKKTLGELRNLSVEFADGEYVCQWDDDDWYDPERLSIQMERLQVSGKPACILSRWIVFDATTGQAYLSNRRLWEGSIMCRRDLLMQNPYPVLPKGEDTQVVRMLYERNMLEIIDDEPELYVYVYHGKNTWEKEHFHQIFECSTILNQSYTSQIANLFS